MRTPVTLTDSLRRIKRVTMAFALGVVAAILAISVGASLWHSRRAAN